jgi:hypothetical protein
MGKNSMVELEPPKETKHQPEHEQKNNDQNPHYGIWYFILTLGLIGFTVFMAIPKSWEEAVTQQDDGTYRLSKKWEETILRKQRKVRKHRLYVLVASTNGYFQCPHSPTGKFYLKAGEVYRYGTTGETFAARGYSKRWLAVHNLTLISIMEGDLATVVAEQTLLIGSYPLLPENLQRPLTSDLNATPYWYRLVLPPGNKSLD